MIVRTTADLDAWLLDLLTAAGTEPLTACAYCGASAADNHLCPGYAADLAYEAARERLVAAWHAEQAGQATKHQPPPAAAGRREEA